MLRLEDYVWTRSAVSLSDILPDLVPLATGVSRSSAKGEVEAWPPIYGHWTQITIALDSLSKLLHTVAQVKTFPFDVGGFLLLNLWR